VKCLMSSSCGSPIATPMIEQNARKNCRSRSSAVRIERVELLTGREPDTAAGASSICLSSDAVAALAWKPTAGVRAVPMPIELVAGFGRDHRHDERRHDGGVELGAGVARQLLHRFDHRREQRHAARLIGALKK
jgi:hypothetical protein